MIADLGNPAESTFEEDALDIELAELTWVVGIVWGIEAATADALRTSRVASHTTKHAVDRTLPGVSLNLKNVRKIIKKLLILFFLFAFYIKQYASPSLEPMYYWITLKFIPW